MKNITIAQAFGGAPPRSAAVLCLRAPDGGTDMILTEWFTWLNIKRQPMISYSMPRDAAIGAKLESGDALALAFPPLDAARRYKDGVHVPPKGQEQPLPEGIEVESPPNAPVQVPAECSVVLLCTLFSTYRYPFKKVKIFNCNLEKALGTRA